MNRQGKSRLNDLLTQLGIPTVKNTGMQADKVWVDEMSYEDKQRILEEMKRGSVVRMYEAVQKDMSILFPPDMKTKGTTKKLRGIP